MAFSTVKVRVTSPNTLIGKIYTHQIAVNDYLIEITGEALVVSVERSRPGTTGIVVTSGPVSIYCHTRLLENGSLILNSLSFSHYQSQLKKRSMAVVLVAVS